MSADIYELIDNGPLLSFGQTNTLDALLASGRKIVITAQVLNEALTPLPSGALREGAAEVTNWLAANSANPNLIVAPVTIDVAAYNGFHPEAALRGTFTE